MKKNIRNGFVFVGVAMILALSFAMPQIVSYAQNRTLESKVSQIENPIISSESTLFERLQFFSSPYARAVELQPAEKIKTETARENALQFLLENGFDEFKGEAFESLYETRFLTMSVDGFRNAVVQQYQLFGEKGMSFTLLLDEKSGKIISFYFDGSSDLPYRNQRKEVEQKVKIWADACVKYYGFETVKIEFLEKESGEQWYSYRLIFENEEEEVLNATFFAATNMCTFYFGSSADWDDSFDGTK